MGCGLLLGLDMRTLDGPRPNAPRPNPAVPFLGSLTAYTGRYSSAPVSTNTSDCSAMPAACATVASKPFSAA